MITGSPLVWHPGWRQLLAQVITDPAELLARLDLGPEWLAPAQAAARLFPLRVPQGFAARMRRGDPHDPLLRQVLPLGDECLAVAGFSRDPVGEAAIRTSMSCRPIADVRDARMTRRPGMAESGLDPIGDSAACRAPGLLQKYTGRALLTATGACAVHCRYCFRRHFPYGEENASADGFRAALAAIADDPTIHEVILSGGDPLTLSDRRLREFSEALSEIPHIERLRVHTRLPVVLPERIDTGFLGWLHSVSVPVVFVVHANHPNEIAGEVAGALNALRSAGVTLLNQSVLLKGVNDDAAVLAGLSEKLFAHGVLPYYLHQLDRVEGAAHFEVADEAARRLHAELCTRLPGYLVPRLVREVQGAPAKLPL